MLMVSASNTCDIWDFQSNEDFLVLFCLWHRGLIGGYQHFTGSYQVHLQDWSVSAADQFVRNEENQSGPKKGTWNSPFQDLP